MDVAHDVLERRVLRVLQKPGETRETDARPTHERNDRPWTRPERTGSDAVLFRHDIRDVCEHVVELVLER